jgi:pimeloyl-ACP methyl ester carboxylesterase
MSSDDLDAPEPDRAVKASGVRLAFDFRGSGPPILLIHGLTFDRLTWQPIIDRLADRYSCIAVDLPGHGDSDGPPLLLNDVASTVHRLLRELAIDRPVVVGHSMGAAVAGIYASTYPVAGVVMVDQAPFVRPFAELVQSLEPFLRSENFATAFEPIRQSIGLDLMPEPLRSEIAARQRIRRDLVIGYWDEIMQTAPDQLQARIDRSISAIDAPCLGVFGRTLADPEREHLLRLLPSAEVEEWPGSGHMVHLVEPGRFAVRLATFAKRCLPADVTKL